jgi:methionyl-tRNA synthetase
MTDECFYKESQIEDRISGEGTSIKVSKETESVVEWTSEENYCFRLSHFREKLLEVYKSYPSMIVPRTYYQDVLNALEDKLEDISISRPRTRLAWGIEVPGDPDQTIYVWFDALVNYLTVTGYPWTNKGLEQNLSNNTKTEMLAAADESGDVLKSDMPTVVEKDANVENSSTSLENPPLTTSSTPEDVLEGESTSPAHIGTQSPVMDNAWPADVHVIGKDIVRYVPPDSVSHNSFHCIFWPAFLMAASIHLPRQILVHGHWTLNGQKMSKSLGNVVSPSEVLDSFHPDVIRYYMIKEGGQEGDGNWNTNSLRNRYTYLAHTWGNLVSRMMSPKMDLRVAVSNVFRKGEYQGTCSHQRQEDDKLRTAVETAIDVYHYNMNNLNFEAALSVLDVLLRAVLS